MVTNERQRRYAVETRSNKALESGKAVKKRITPRDGPETPSTATEPPSRYPEIDPKLDQYHYNLDPAFASTSADSSAPPPNTDADVSVSREQPFPTSPPPADSPISYHIHILHNSTRIRPKLTLSPQSCPGFSSLVQHVRGVLNDDAAEINRIRIHCPEGLTDVGEEEAWLDAVKSVEENEWMEGHVRIIVEVGFRDEDVH
jgi:hypothetical protein